MGNARFCKGVPQTDMFVPMLAILFDGRRAGEWLAKMKAAGILPNLLSHDSTARRLRQEDHRLRRHFLHPWRSFDALRRQTWYEEGWNRLFRLLFQKVFRLHF